MRETIELELKNIFSTVLGIDPSLIDLALSPDNCPKWDSLAHIHLISAIEEKYNLTLPIEVQVEILTFELAVLTIIEFLKD